MKLLKWFAIVVLIVLGGVYTLAFTSFGNGIVAPIIESKIQKATKIGIKLQKFALNMSNFDILVALDKENLLEAKGSYSLFSQSFDFNYNIAFHNLSSLEKLAQRRLNGAFSTNGKVVGNLDLFNVDGKSDVAKSDTTYHVKLQNLNPTSIIAQVKKANLATILFMLDQKKYANAKIDLDVNFKDIKPHELDGNVKLLTTQGKLNTKVMQKDFGITIPKTAFKMKLDGKLKGDDLIYSCLLNSNLAKINSKGTVVPQPLQLDATYSVNVEKLAVLKPMTGANIRGKLNLSGSVKGTKERMTIVGKSDLASSNTDFKLLLKEFKPDSLEGDIRHLKLQNLLYMVKQPHYTDALINIKAKLSNLDPKNLQGNVLTQIKKGIVDSGYLTKKFGFKNKMPYTTFSGVAKTKLQGQLIDTKTDFASTLADININSTKFSLKDSSIMSDYKIKVHDLDTLYFATQKHLKGSIVVAGELKKAKDLNLTLLSNIAGGTLDAKLHNDDFVATLSNMRTLDLLDILIYPKILKSKVDATIKYHLAKANGNLRAKLSEGIFTENQVLDLTKQFAKIDLYAQKFKGNINADIKKEQVTALIDLKSNTSSIYTKDAKLDTKTKNIDSKIRVIANNNPPLYMTLSGDISKPRVRVNASAIIKNEAKKAIKNKVNKLFQKLF